MKLSRLSLADYNQLDSIPVINQDLTASGFTPVANTYYRHTGATTDTFTQGVIYLYDTAYHKLGESGGGTTLNQYTYTANLKSPSYAIMNTIHLIAQNAARYSASMEIKGKLSDGKSVTLYGAVLLNSEYYGYNGVLCSTANYIAPIYVDDAGSQINVVGCCIKGSTISTFTETSSIKLTVVYYNDTEITYQ